MVIVGREFFLFVYSKHTTHTTHNTILIHGYVVPTPTVQQSSTKLCKAVHSHIFCTYCCLSYRPLKHSPTAQPPPPLLPPPPPSPHSVVTPLPIPHLTSHMKVQSKPSILTKDWHFRSGGWAATTMPGCIDLSWQRHIAYLIRPCWSHSHERHGISSRLSGSLSSQSLPTLQCTAVAVVWRWEPTRAPPACATTLPWHLRHLRLW